MDLTFLGRGSAFYPKEGNTSAYFIENKQLFLIDCGESVFKELLEKGILESIDEINLLLTHTHSAHIGSIGSLTLYSYYTLQKPLQIIMKEGAKYITNINKILSGFGCTKEMYHYISEKEFDYKYQNFQSVRLLETRHVDELHCYGILFQTENGLIYYSGDTKELVNIKLLLESKEKIDKIYVDTSAANFPGNPHLYIEDLYKEIPEKFRDKIFCMHFNNEECMKKASQLGFHVVSTEKHKIFELKK